MDGGAKGRSQPLCSERHVQTGPCRAPAAGTEQNEGGFHNKSSEASEANRTNSEVDAVKMFAFGKVAASREGGREGGLCNSKWVFSNSILFGENNPSWSALFSPGAGNNSPPQWKELGFSVAVPLTGSQPRLCSQPSCPAGAGEVTSKS